MIALSSLLILLACSSSSANDVLFWRPTSNWNDPSNWNQSRLPCSAETVVIEPPKSLNGMALPASFDVAIQGNVALKKLVIPKMGSLSLRRRVKITFKRVATCKDEGYPDVTDESKNSFIGVKPRPWNCPTNWRRSDGSIPNRSPCGNETAFFPSNSTFSWIVLDTPVTVARLGWRGQPAKSLSDISNYNKEFFKTPSGDLLVDSTCLTRNPERCPCQAADESPLCMYPSTVSPSSLLSGQPTEELTWEPTQRGQTGGEEFPWPILVGVLGGIILILIIVVVIVIVTRRRRKYRYDNEEDNLPLPGQDYAPKDQTLSSSGFRNPLYSGDETGTVENPMYAYADPTENPPFASDYPPTNQIYEDLENDHTATENAK